MTNKKITKDMSMHEVLMSNPDAAEVLFKSGMGCVGCPAAQMETLEQGCLAHGMTEKQVDEIIDILNRGKKK
jgi:hybrid cluster-associated redox disulfide protein